MKLSAGFSLTVTTQVAVKPPSTVVTVISASPTVTAVTLPSATVATPSSLEVQVTLLSVAFSGSTVAVRLALSPSVRASSAASRLTPVTATTSGSFSSQPAYRVRSPVTGVSKS